MYPATSISGGERWAVIAHRGPQIMERWFDSKDEAVDFADILENSGFEDIAVDLLPQLAPIRDMLKDRGVA
ncbi:MAG: hypothetical protein MPJ50_19275 [Pirellulales bacterium]|nr:hypothetical protein [Pirellulales bacterium]